MPEIPEQIIFRLDNKKMVYSERFDWLKIEITMLWSEICLHLGLSFCCLAWSNRFQVRDQEDAEHRDVRLATDRDRHSLVRVLLFGFCTRMVSMLILPRTTRPCRPQGGFGLVMMMMTLKIKRISSDPNTLHMSLTDQQ